MILWGDSAGGTVAVLTALALQGAHKPLGSLVLTNLDLSLEHYDDDAPRGPGRTLLAGGITAWADGAEDTISPLAMDLSGLDRVLVSVGAADALVEEARAFVERGQPSWRLPIHPGAGHGFVSCSTPADAEAMAATLAAIQPPAPAGA